MGIPEFLPVLSNGSHSSPEVGACLMEYASILAGEKFSSAPHCVHPLLRGIGINVNDSTPHGVRNKLALLLPRLIGTGDEKRWTGIPGNRLAQTMWVRAAEPSFGPSRGHALWNDPFWSPAIGAAELGGHWQAVQLIAITAGARGRGYEFLERCIDVFDEMTARVPPEPITTERFRELAAKVGAAV